MEVQLKKTKITQSILKQTMTSVYLEDLKGYESLGWVFWNKEKFAVFHKDGVLRKLVLNTVLNFEAVPTQINEQGDYKRVPTIFIKRPQRYNTMAYFETESEALEYKKLYEELLTEVKQKGQFYI